MVTVVGGMGASLGTKIQCGSRVIRINALIKMIIKLSRKKAVNGDECLLV